MTSDRPYDIDAYPDTSDYEPEVRALMDAAIASEREALLERKRELEECECKDGMFPSPQPNRRGFLLGAAVTGSAAALPILAQAASPGAVNYPVQKDPTKEQGRAIFEDKGYGSRSQFETEARWRFPTKTLESSWTMTPLEKGRGIMTASGLHFERHHGGIPNIDPAGFSLIVHGMVDRPKKYSMADLHRFPSISRQYFIECSGNTFSEWKKATLKTVQHTHGLTSTAEWTGVALSTILSEVGVKDGAAWILAEGADAAVMTRSVPLDKAWGDAMLAYAQNGEAIRPEQGHPLRLFLPGFEGNTHIKWLRRLEISDQPFMSREETSKYTDPMKGGKARQFTFTMDPKSVITFPSGEMKLPGAGFYEITGLAWTGRGKVRQVDISSDGGKTWHAAVLQQPVQSICHTRFRYPWMWDGKPALLQSRCIDETGYTQPTVQQLVETRGINGHPKFASIYHNNMIQSWSVDSDGSVKNGNHMA